MMPSQRLQRLTQAGRPPRSKKGYRYSFAIKRLLEEHLRELATLVHRENGKTMEEAIAEVEKSIELTEFACSMPQLVQGRILEVSKGVECRIDRKPVGRRRIYRTLQLSAHGSSLDNPQCPGTGQLYDPQTIRTGARFFQPDS
jgi:hypothetical protein